MSKEYNRPDNPYRYTHAVEEAANTMRDAFSAHRSSVWNYGRSAAGEMEDRIKDALQEARSALDNIESIAREMDSQPE